MHAGVQLFGNMAFEQGCGRTTIQIDDLDAGVGIHQSDDVVGDDGVVLNRTVEAAVALGTGNDVPQGDAVVLEQFNALCIVA